MTIEAPNKTVAEKLGDLRIELVELAVILDRRGHLDAADVAMATSARINELCKELADNV